ncbi:MAG: DUF5946 family protein [Gemmatimonadota bacterium]
MTEREQCVECSATYDVGNSCRLCFESLLAYENETPVAFGAVHHLTVPAFFLMHPAGYSAAILRAWRDAIAASMDDGVTPRELQRRHRAQFEGSTRVRQPGARAPEWWPREWPLTVHSILMPGQRPDADRYVHCAREWAMAVRQTIDACVPPARAEWGL